LRERRAKPFDALRNVSFGGSDDSPGTEGSEGKRNMTWVLLNNEYGECPGGGASQYFLVGLMTINL
jgi:hypothetical protein